MKPFSQYRDWLASPEYKAQMEKLVGEKPSPARTDWPLNFGELSDRHRAFASMCIEAAARHMRLSEDYATRSPATDRTGE